MKNVFNTAFICGLALFFACHSEQETTKDSSVRKKIRIKGSDTEYLMVSELAKAYAAIHPNTEIITEGGGSNAGLIALTSGQCDICNSSREIKESELNGIKKSSAKLLPFIFSTDALAIITNYRVGVDSLSTDQITQLFCGEIKNWQELGGENLPVLLYGRNKSSGTRNYFTKKLLSYKRGSRIIECASNKAILDSVILKPGAVGYVGTGFLFDEKGKPNGAIWAMPVYVSGQRAVSPYQTEAVKRGEYVLTRPLYQNVVGAPEETARNFMLFELTKTGQDIVIKHGFFPINDLQTQINRLKGLTE